MTLEYYVLLKEERMWDITIQKAGRNYFITSNKLSLQEWATTIKEAKKNFKTAVILMLKVEMDDIKRLKTCT